MKLPLEGRWLGLAALVAVGFAGILIVAVRFVEPAATAATESVRTAF
ncbi:MAG: hypothetical protein QM760_01710 [Nibricoccus sp.]